jgi:hypothetical protein
MTGRSDSDLVIAAWLTDEARDGAPERLIEATRRQLERTNQRRALWPAWRLSPMNARIAAGAAVVVIAVAAGIIVLPRWSESGQNPTPSPASPSPGPTTSASTSAAGIPLDGATVGSGGLAPGRYLIGEPFPVPLTLTIPDGWDIWLVAPDRAGLLAWTESEPGSGWPLAFWIVDEVEAGTCGSEQAAAVGSSATDFVDAMTSVAGYEMTEPVPVTVGGYDGWRVGVAPGTCAGDTLFSTAADRFAIAEGELYQVSALDVDGQLVVITSADFPGTTAFEETYRSPDPSLHADHLAEVASIIESITFGP